MTKLNGKTVKREIQVPGIPRPLGCTLDGECYQLRMREKGSRTEYYFPIGAAYIEAVKMGWVVGRPKK